MNNQPIQVAGQIVDIINKSIYPGTVHIKDGKIISIIKEAVSESQYILPGFIDAHIHIESSMLVPYEFARIALNHGTVATISDPHEIANVLGVKGVEYMLDNAQGSKLKFHFGAPSCVPATSFETSGATIDSTAIASLLAHPSIYYLSEMMNYPGVLFDDDEVLKKIKIAHQLQKPVDGHAPGLRGDQAKKYIAAGISTDHECFTYDEALEKLNYGMKILIREGSAAKNFEALHPLIQNHSDQLMFCCDDQHPDELLKGHIDLHVRRAVALGYDLFDVLKMACINPVEHYKMDVGLLRKGDSADMICVNNLTEFKILKTIIEGEIVSDGVQTFLPIKQHQTPNNFNANEKTVGDFKFKIKGKKLRVIEAKDGQLITGEITCHNTNKTGDIDTDVEKDILKIAVVNRYNDTIPATALIKNFGLKRGAIAASVAHDSHNIVVVGCDDESIAKAVNLIIKNKGGLSLVDNEFSQTIALPVAGLMSDLDCKTIGNAYQEIDQRAKQMGSNLKAPFMLLSFMSLLVIPELKLSDKGLFDGKKFEFSSVVCDE